MPATSYKNKSRRTMEGKPSEGVMKKAQAGLEAQRMNDAPHSVSPTSPERFGKLRQRTEDTIFKNDDSNRNDISPNDYAAGDMQRVAGAANKPNTWKYEGQHNVDNQANQMKKFQEGGRNVPQNLKQRRERIYGENDEVKGAREEFDYEQYQQQRFAAQQRERHRQQEMRRRAEDAADGAEFSSPARGGAMRWGEGMSTNERRFNNMDRSEGGYLNRNVPQELESSVRKNPYAAPRNEAAAKQRSANSSPFPNSNQQQFMYNGTAGTDYPQGNVRYYEHDEGEFDEEYEDGDEEDAEYNDNRRFWEYETRSPFQKEQQQNDITQEMKEHPGNLYGGDGIMTAAEGEIDDDVYQDDDEGDEDSEAPFSSSAFDSLDYEYLRYVNEREAIRQRLNEAREQRRRSLDIHEDDYDEDDDMMDNDESDEYEDAIDKDDEELADLDARVNYLLYLRSLQAQGDPDAEGLLREYYHAHYGSEAYERARERFMNRLDDDEADEARALKNEILDEDEEAGILEGIDDDDLLNEDDDEAIIEEVLQRSHLSNPYPNLVPYHWSSAAPKRMREEYAHPNEEDFFDDDEDEDEDEGDIYTDDYEDDGDYYINRGAIASHNEERQSPSIYNTYGAALRKQSRPEVYADPSAGLNDDIYKNKENIYQQPQAKQQQTSAATAAEKGVFAAASAARVAQQVGGSKPHDDLGKNKNQWSKDNANKNRRTYTVPESVARYKPSDAEIMMLFLGVLPFYEDISLGSMPRDRKPRAARKPRGVVEGDRNRAPPSPINGQQNHFMYSNAPAPNKVLTGTHLDDMDKPMTTGMMSPAPEERDRSLAIAALPFAMDDSNGAMPNDKKFGDGQLILMEQARKEKMKRDIARGYDANTHSYKGPSRKEYGKKMNRNNTAAGAAPAAPVNTETVNRMAKVFDTLFADSDDEAKNTKAAKGDTKLTVVTDTRDIAMADKKALSESKRSEAMQSLTTSQNSNFRPVVGATAVPNKNISGVRKDKNDDSMGPAPITITADHPRNDMTENSGKSKASDQTMSADGTPLITPPRVLNTEAMNDHHNVSDSTRFDSGFVAPANSLISDPNIASSHNGKNRTPQGQLHGALDAPRNGSVNHLDGKNYEGAHLSTDAEMKKEGEERKIEDKPVPVVASSIAPPSFVVGPTIAKEAKEEAGMTNNNNNNSHIKDERVATGAPILVDRPTAATANANTGVTEGKNAVPIVHEAADKMTSKPHISPSAPEAEKLKQDEKKKSAVPPTGRPIADSNATSAVVSSAPTEVPVHNAAARFTGNPSSAKPKKAEKSSWNCRSAPATKDQHPRTVGQQNKKTEEKKK